MPKPSAAERIVLAEKHLRKVDPVMARLIARHGPCTLGSKRPDPFHTLAKSIISQQLSTKAANTIAARVLAAAGADRHEAAHFLAATHEQLRGCGLSNAKAKWLRDIAGRVQTGEFSFKQLVRLDDEAAIEMLDALPGIGRWSAEMYLMFALGRLDLFAMDDVGLRRGVSMLYGKGRALSDRRTLKIVKPWAPYRSVASWYLWRV
ncbi:MAG: DNA-3-methyladenine glycosylase 2 family protein, partial [Hydrocarboniphaga effusa]|nr:DNA-3-methyladenine glycosylase 2 family protein [Hydrocarboniphaga effusa]